MGEASVEGGQAGGSSFPPARGQRLPWHALPASVRQAMETRFGARIERVATQSEGFSPAVAARIVLDDGTRLFLKAAGPLPNPEAPPIYRMEMEIAGQLPPGAAAPHLLWTHDDGEWVALVFEDVAGSTPELPWVRPQLDRVIDAVVGLARTMTPSPVRAPPVSSRLATQFAGWRHVAAEGDEALSQISRIDAWAGRNARRLAALEASWAGLAVGDSLIHGDIRADNVLITEDRVIFVDWPWASVGPDWMDLAFFLPSVAMQGGPEPWSIFDASPLGRSAPPEAVTAVLAALAGFFVWNSCRAAPPGLPTLRSFQRAQGLATLRWLRQRTGWT
jgi:aminoglycoside phosphotransferase (APT) family kinase protein